MLRILKYKKLYAQIFGAFQQYPSNRKIFNLIIDTPKKHKSSGYFGSKYLTSVHSPSLKLLLFFVARVAISFAAPFPIYNIHCVFVTLNIAQGIGNSFESLTKKAEETQT